MPASDPLSPINPFIMDADRLSLLSGALACLPPGSDEASIECAIRATLPAIAWSERHVSSGEVHLKPPSVAALRRCVRVVAMVHELHKVGYQRIRAIPQEAPNGNHWRCHITHAANVLPDGYSLIDFDHQGRGIVAHYSTGQGNEFFGWRDATRLSARELAALFLRRFPAIANNGRGRDWLYAGWLTDFLGNIENAESAGLLSFTADYPLDPKAIDPWMPPPPR